MTRKKKSKIVWIIVLLLFIFYFKPDFFGALITPTKIEMTNYQGSLSSLRWFQDLTIKPIVSNSITIDKYRFDVSVKEFGQVLGKPYCSVITDYNLRNYLKEEFDMTCSYGEGFGDYCGVSNQGYEVCCCDGEENQEGVCVGIKNIQKIIGDDCEKITFDYQKQNCNKLYPFVTAGGQYFESCREGDWYNTQTGTETFGGLTQNILFEETDYKNCWQKVEIYENNELIRTLDWDTHLYQGANRVISSLEGLSTSFMHSWERGDYDGCIWIENIFSFTVPEEKLDFIIDAPAEFSVVDQEAKVEIKLINNWKPIKGNLLVHYEIPTAIGSAEKTTEEIIDFPLGEKIITYNIPTTQITDRIFITPKLDILNTGNQFLGVNGQCYKESISPSEYKDLSLCSFVLVAEITDTTHTVSVISEAEYLRGELTLREQEIIALEASLQEKARLINELNLSIEKQVEILEKMELNLAEKVIMIQELRTNIDDQAEIVNTLNLTLTEKILMIQDLTVNIGEQAEIVRLMELNLTEKISMVKELTQNLNEQIQIVSNLDLKIEEQAQMINSLTSIQLQQAQIINSLNLTTLQQIELIKELTTQADRQGQIISNLDLIIEDQLFTITSLTDEKDKQAIMINELKLNLAEKAEAIDKLTVTNEEQAEMITAMKLSFADQAYIIDELNLTIEGDATLISNLELSLSEQRQLVNILQLSQTEKDILIAELQDEVLKSLNTIKELNLNLEEAGNYIANLEFTNQQKAQVIIDLNLNLDEQSVFIDSLNLKISDQIEIISSLKLTIAEEGKLISRLNLTIGEQAIMVEELSLTIKEDAELINRLNLKVSEQAEIIDRLKLNINELIELVNELDLTTQEQLDLVAQLKLTIQEQQEIIKGLGEEPSEPTEIPTYVWYIIGFLLFWIIFLRK